MSLQRLNIEIGIQRLNADLSFSLEVPGVGIFDQTFDLTFN